MEVDLDQATGASHYTADLCIAGAGIAGLTLANALVDSGLQIILLEGGGNTLEPRSQELYRVEMTGQLHKGATEGRFRIFGGSSTQWGGQLLPYSEDVFNPPVGTGMEKWPVHPDELRRFYPSVLQMFGVPDEPFEAQSLCSGRLTEMSPGTDVNVRFSRWAPFTQRNLATTLGKRCLESKKITTFLHANVTRLELGPNGNNVSRLHVSNFMGKAFTFSARHFVVSLGTIESARLLLASNAGNDHDQVGRYFHDHLSVHAATLRSAAREAAIRLFAPRVRRNVVYTPKLEATAKWRAQHAAQAVMAHFPIIEPDNSAIANLKFILKALQQRDWQPGLTGKVFRLPAASLELLKLAYATKVVKRRPVSKHAQFRLNIDVEQRPLIESRISLSDQADRFGMPISRLNWKISDSEKRTVRMFAETAKAELEAANIRGIDIHPEITGDDGDWLSLVTDTYHMMGGTRMGTNKTESVVDSGLKVHGVENLYVASCSVFPSGGSSNPTFTMMALTLRLAEVLRNSLPNCYTATAP